MLSLGYSSWDKFKNVIERAVISYENSESLVEEHFSQLGKSLDLPNGAKKYIENYDYMLTRYACYLIAQNGSPRKKQVALAQTKKRHTRERPISSVYPVIDTDLARDNVENDLTAADLQDLE